MTDPQIAIFMLCLFIVLVLLGFPIAFTLIAMGVGFGYYAYYQGGIETFSDVFNNNIFYLLNQNTYSVMENDTLVAIPLFLFMGYVVERANIVNRLFYSLQMAARNLTWLYGDCRPFDLCGFFYRLRNSWCRGNINGTFGISSYECWL